MTCELEFAAGRQRGIVLDVSPRGLFVQTDTRAELGAPVRVRLRGADGENLDLDAEVARKRVVPQRLASVAQGGLGLRVRNAPEAFFALAGGPTSGAAARPAPRAASAPASPTPTRGTAASGERLFRVRVQQCGGPRSRKLLVNAPDEDAACARALEDLGEEWKVLEVLPA